MADPALAVDDRTTMSGHAAWVIAIGQRIADLSARIFAPASDGGR